MSIAKLANPVTTSYSLSDYIPLLSPAVKSDSCALDYSLLRRRIGVVFLVVISSMALATLLAPQSILFLAVLTAATPIMFLLPVLDWMVSKRAVDTKAVKEYLQPVPSRSATFWIQHNLRAAKELVKAKGDLDKPNEEGRRLVDYIPEPAVFELLVKEGASVHLTTPISMFGSLLFSHLSCLDKIVANGQASALFYIFKFGKLKASDLTSEQQQGLWRFVGDEKVAQHLKANGIAIDAVDKNGQTALQSLVISANNKYVFEGKTGSLSNGKPVTLDRQIEILLAMGADYKSQVKYADKLCTLLQLSTEPRVIKLLKEAEAKEAAAIATP